MMQTAHESISATELVRNLSAMIDKVRMSGRSLYITKGTQTVAELSPPPRSGYPIVKLASLLNSLPKLDSDAEAMAKDLKKIKARAGLPESSWD
jgi:antitoxin (DNA-binding transcriptional repressor) of toxin-antitoxin stability system